MNPEAAKQLLTPIVQEISIENQLPMVMDRAQITSEKLSAINQQEGFDKPVPVANYTAHSIFTRNVDALRRGGYTKTLIDQWCEVTGQKLKESTEPNDSEKPVDLVAISLLKELGTEIGISEETPPDAARLKTLIPLVQQVETSLARALFTSWVNTGKTPELDFVEIPMSEVKAALAGSEQYLRDAFYKFYIKVADFDHVKMGEWAGQRMKITLADMKKQHAIKTQTGSMQAISADEAAHQATLIQKDQALAAAKQSHEAQIRQLTEQHTTQLAHVKQETTATTDAQTRQEMFRVQELLHINLPKLSRAAAPSNANRDTAELKTHVTLYDLLTGKDNQVGLLAQYGITKDSVEQYPRFVARVLSVLENAALVDGEKPPEFALCKQILEKIGQQTPLNDQEKHLMKQIIDSVKTVPLN